MEAFQVKGETSLCLIESEEDLLSKSRRTIVLKRIMEWLNLFPDWFVDINFGSIVSKAIFVHTIRDGVTFPKEHLLLILPFCVLLITVRTQKACLCHQLLKRVMPSMFFECSLPKEHWQNFTIFPDLLVWLLLWRPSFPLTHTTLPFHLPRKDTKDDKKDCRWLGRRQDTTTIESNPRMKPTQRILLHNKQKSPFPSLTTRDSS